MTLFKEKNVNTYRHFIDGEWLSGGTDFARDNPSIGEKLGIFPKGGAHEVDAAVSAATNALSNWKALSLSERANFVLECAKWFEDQYGVQGDITALKQLIMDEVG